MKKLSKIFFSIFILVSSSIHAKQYCENEKIYIDPDEFHSNIDGDEFHLHVGENVWLVTHTIHRDSTGMFAFESYLKKMKGEREYQRSWKCPYCFNYWPIGTPCKKTDCPSKYR